MIKIWLSGGVVHIEGVESLLRHAPQHLSIEPTAPQVEAPEPAAESVRATYVDGALPYVKFNGKAKAEEPTVEVPAVNETPEAPPARRRGRPRKEQPGTAVPAPVAAPLADDDAEQQEVQEKICERVRQLMVAKRNAEVLKTYKQFQPDAQRLGQVPTEHWPGLLAALDQLLLPAAQEVEE